MATGLIIADFGTMNNNTILTFTVFNILSYISLISQFRNRKVTYNYTQYEKPIKFQSFPSVSVIPSIGKE